MKIEIDHYIDNKIEYRKAQLTEALQKEYADHPDPIESYRVQFKMVNRSGFALKKPTVTFRLPCEKQHPDKPQTAPYTIRIGPEFYSTRGFHSNLYNYQRELRILEFGETLILSNSNLPYWNNEDEVIFWIRMVLNDKKLCPFNVIASVNCENADGTTKRIHVAPRKLLDIRN